MSAAHRDSDFPPRRQVKGLPENKLAAPSLLGTKSDSAVDRAQVAGHDLPRHTGDDGSPPRRRTADVAHEQTTMPSLWRSARDMVYSVQWLTCWIATPREIAKAVEVQEMCYSAEPWRGILLCRSWLVG